MLKAGVSRLIIRNKGDYVFLYATYAYVGD